ncbi:HEPN domain-containing protein [Mesorhizobium sp. CA8]|uniref:HEPN domain-containing protein n=1 Tax=Mesorhizobium sp. CA8 TaxID=2876637 RepID=UPI001CCC996C|nr:HEPN domain-containing protein [Mesorhizobium sp. CA8]MBZ9761314.1 HEPN domain-containing protein [Mesorhizobium sp. CA8]
MSGCRREGDEDQRTTSAGLYHYAVSYHKAARALADIDTGATHRDSPVYFLHYHAVELYLKAFLRLHGVSVAELAGKKFGHRTDRLSGRASTLGLLLNGEDVEVLRFMAETDIVIRSRYIITGYFTMPTLKAMDRTCQSLRESVGDAIRKSGTFVRG